jgi:hypothetical protein
MFDDLLGLLRDSEEWRDVERELELRLTRNDASNSSDAREVNDCAGTRNSRPIDSPLHTDCHPA